LLDRKAVDPVVLDLRGLTAATDYFVIVSGTSDAHVRGMADHLVTALAPAGLEPHHVEGLAQGRWFCSTMWTSWSTYFIPSCVTSTSSNGCGGTPQWSPPATQADGARKARQACDVPWLV